MKAKLFSAAGVGLGAAWFGLGDAPDFDREVARPPMAVYAAFSRLAQEGTTTRREAGKDGVQTVTVRTDKEPGRAIRYEIALNDRPVVTVDLGFAAANEGGTATRLTAEFDIDAYELGSAYETEAGVALSMVPESLIDMQFAAFMDELVKDVEAGRPLPPLGLRSAGVRRQRASADVDTRRSDAARARRDASRPMVRATPMVDPDRAASNYRRTGDAQLDPRDGWGE